jgi:hypothetical protein
VGLEWGPLSLVRTTEELFRRKSSSSGQKKSEIMTIGDPPHCDAPLSANVGINKRQLLGRYSLLVN